MTEHETQIVKRALSHAQTEVRAAQRCVEVLANLFEDMRHELYPHQASRIWYVLNQIQNLECVAMNMPHEKEKAWPSANQRYRWVFMDRPANFEMRNLAQDMEELSELLSGVKIEDVAQSKAHESYLRYMDPNVKIRLNATGWRNLEDDLSALGLAKPEVQP